MHTMCKKNNFHEKKHPFGKKIGRNFQTYLPIDTNRNKKTLIIIQIERKRNFRFRFFQTEKRIFPFFTIFVRF